MLFTSYTKTLQILKQIDTARCKGHWHALPNLARRYVKYNPEGAALEQTVLAEVALVRMGQANKPWNPKQALSIQDQLQSVFEINHDLSGELKESAKVILARLFFGSKEYDQVLALLDGLSLLNAQSTGYSFCLYFQSLAIQAMSLEAMGNHETCLQIYQQTLELLRHHQPIKDLTLIEWAEETLYRAIQLVSNHTFSAIVEEGTLLELLWAHHRTTCHQPVTWRAERRMGTTLLMIKLLIKLYNSGEYIPHVSTPADGLPDAYDDQKAFAQEIIQLYTICELMLQATAPTSITGDGNNMVLDVIESLFVDLDWIIEEKEDWRGCKEILERASEKTFNSPTILRLMFFTSLRLGEYEEAEHQLQSYLQLVGLVSQGQIESRTDGNAPVQDSCGLYLPLSSSSTLLAPPTNDTKRTDSATSSCTNNNKECPDQLVDVLVRAMWLYCSELKDGIKAVEMAELALALVQKHTPMDPRHVAKVYNSSGVAYSLLASEIIDDGLRPSYHQNALRLLEQANALQHECWKTLYCLAHQHLNMRNIDKAIHSIQHSLSINKDHLPSWHLLVLALSCSGQNSRPQALSIASAGLQIALDQISSSTSSYDQLEQYLLMKMTYSRLLHSSEGPEMALEEHSSLFNLYGKWAATLKTEIGNSGNDSLVREHQSMGAGQWHGCISNGGKNGKPRKILLFGPFGSVTPSVSTASLNNRYPLSTTSSSLTTTTTKSSNKFRRRRSASSSMVGNLEPTIVIPHCDSASVLTIASDGNKAHLSSLAQKSPSLRKYASNSMLRIPSSHWPNPSTSHSASLQSSPSQAVSMNGSSSNDSISRQSSSGKDTSRYSSMYSFQSGNSSFTGGHTAATLASMNDSSNSTTAPTIQQLSLLNQQRSRSALTTSEYLQQHNQNARLCELWLMSAEWYYELSETEEALKAISEAESVCPTHPGVWCLLGRIKHSAGTKDDDGSDSTAQFFEKGLLLQPGHVDCQIELAKLYMEQQDFCTAEGILESLTRGFGWHSSEAWFLLGMVYQQTNRKHRTKECLFYALELESVTPICSFDVLPRVI